MSKNTKAINPSSSPSSRMSPFNRSLSSPSPSTSTLQKLLGPLPRVGTNPSKVHCASGELHDDGKCEETRKRNEKKTSTSTSTPVTPWFARRLLPSRSQDHMVTHTKPCDEEPSARITCSNSSRLTSSPGTQRGSISSIRRALSHRSSSSSSYFTARQRRDSLELIYKQSDNGVKYRPAIPHPLMELAGGFEVMEQSNEGDSLKLPSSLVAERSRRGAQA